MGSRSNHRADNLTNVLGGSIFVFCSKVLEKELVAWRTFHYEYEYSPAMGLRIKVVWHTAEHMKLRERAKHDTN